MQAQLETNSKDEALRQIAEYIGVEGARISVSASENRFRIEVCTDVEPDLT